jgi:aryl-alcohol dehydrogenase-like predicted oxidoreductase
MGVIAWSPLNGGWLTGKYRKDTGIPAGSRAERARIPERFDISAPGNQRKLELIDELDQLARDAGMSLTHLALAWVLEHPAVTAAIIGPKTMEQLDDLLAARGLRVPHEVLDRIDELVTPGTTLHPSDNGRYSGNLQPRARRRA